MFHQGDYGGALAKLERALDVARRRGDATIYVPMKRQAG